MRILLCSYVFAPSLGGIETVSRILAEQFTQFGSQVTVVTDTPGPERQEAYGVVRRPTAKKLYELARGADIALQSNISLRLLAPLLASRRPVVVAHHTWIRRADGGRGWQDYIKSAVLPACRHIAISKAIAAALPVRSEIIGDPFEPGEFRDLGDDFRTLDLVFLGRLVSDKGCDLALRGLAILKAGGLRPKFSIIGDGPEAPALKQLAKELGLLDQVTFLGAMGDGRGRTVAQHKVMVIPSIWEEPFGVVALEGLAAGCVLVASSGGGLADAVGPCGLLFKNGDAAAMAAALKEVLTNPSLREKLLAERKGHLEKFQPEVVARQYLEVFETAIRE